VSPVQPVPSAAQPALSHQVSGLLRARVRAQSDGSVGWGAQMGPEAPKGSRVDIWLMMVNMNG